MDSLFRQLGLLELDGYRFERFLSGGQMASIAIYGNETGRVAAKFLIAPRRDLELEVFRREAETLLMLRRYGQSPTIVKALSNVRSLDPLPVHYFFMDYVPGVTVKELLEQERPPWEAGKALDLLKRVTMALVPAAANAQIHRDLHPGNIIVTDQLEDRPHALIPHDPGVRILDFGVGRNWLADQRDNWQEDRFRHPGAISSWSPELLADPSQVDVKHDIWALGNLFYRLLTGEWAFFAETFQAYYALVTQGQYDRGPVADQPPEIQRLLAAMFEVEPRKRISLGGLLKITTDLTERGLVAWLAAHPALADLYFLVEGNVWTCPLCQKTGSPTTESRCRSCGRYVEEFLLPF